MKRSRLLLSMLVTAFIVVLLSIAISAKPTIKLNKNRITIKVGQTKKLRVKGTKNKVKWKSSNKKVAKVSSNGVVKGGSVGKAIITGKVDGKILKCKVIVSKNSSDNESPQITNGGNIDESNTSGNNTDSVGSDKENGSTTNPEITNNTSDIHGSNENKTAPNIGSTESDKDNSSTTSTDETNNTSDTHDSDDNQTAPKEGETESKKNITYIGITPNAYEMAVGERFSFMCDIMPVNVTDRRISWSSSDDSVVTVDETGTLRALSAGTAVIKAMASSDVYAESHITVYDIMINLPCPSTLIWNNDSDGQYTALFAYTIDDVKTQIESFDRTNHSFTLKVTLHGYKSLESDKSNPSTEPRIQTYYIVKDAFANIQYESGRFIIPVVSKDETFEFSDTISLKGYADSDELHAYNIQIRLENVK